MRRRAALGFRAHSGWAVLVAVAGAPGSPVVIGRRRIELVDGGMPKQPYHAAEGLELKKAEALVKRCVDGARLLARQGVSAALTELEAKGCEAVACGILLASGRPLPALDAILASHALIHTAEGELFRNALAHAAEHCRLPVTRVKEKELLARGAAGLGVAVEELERRVNELGKSIGPPWRQDEKYAALAGWLALSAHEPTQYEPGQYGPAQ